MPSATILLLESSRASAPSFAPALEKWGYTLLVRHSVDEALAAAAVNRPDLIILDAASMGTPGTRMCRRLSTSLNGVPIVLVTLEGAQTSADSGASLALAQPFTPRKLINRLAGLLPADERYDLRAGPITLNLVQRKVTCGAKEAYLTPKQTELLEVFMRNPGKLVTRKKLIRKVWRTNYTGDTRTLDVHISWLRSAIEADPSRPQLLRTIRGLGYRLDLPE